MQFAERSDGYETEPLAMKFFVKRADYDAESKTFRSIPRALRNFLPKVDKYIDNRNGAMKDPFGNTLPPCIVMTRCESLLDKAQNSRIDVFSASGVRLLLFLVIIENYSSIELSVFLDPVYAQQGLFLDVCLSETSRLVFWSAIQ